MASRTFYYSIGALIVVAVILIILFTGGNSNSNRDVSGNIILVNTSGNTDNTDTNTNSGSNSGIITLNELAVHNSQDDCWVAYQGEVYDVTSWLPRHPGTAEAIAPYCGTSAEFEAAFTQQHNTSKVSRLMQEGVLMGELGNM